MIEVLFPSSVSTIHSYLSHATVTSFQTECCSSHRDWTVFPGNIPSKKRRSAEPSGEKEGLQRKWKWSRCAGFEHILVVPWASWSCIQGNKGPSQWLERYDLEVGSISGWKMSVPIPCIPWRCCPSCDTVWWCDNSPLSLPPCIFLEQSQNDNCCTIFFPIVSVLLPWSLLWAFWSTVYRAMKRHFWCKRSLLGFSFSKHSCMNIVVKHKSACICGEQSLLRNPEAWLTLNWVWLDLSSWWVIEVEWHGFHGKFQQWWDDVWASSGFWKWIIWTNMIQPIMEELCCHCVGDPLFLKLWKI